MNTTVAQSSTKERDFLDNLLITAGFNPEQDNFEELKEDLEPLLYESIIVTIYNSLSAEQRKKFDEFMESIEDEPETNITNEEAFQKGEEMMQFFRKMNPNADTLIEEACEKFAKTYLQAMEPEDSNEATPDKDMGSFAEVEEK